MVIYVMSTYFSLLLFVKSLVTDSWRVARLTLRVAAGGTVGTPGRPLTWGDGHVAIATAPAPFGTLNLELNLTEPDENAVIPPRRGRIDGCDMTS